MSTGLSHSCYESPHRNPWVTEKDGERSISSGPQQAQTDAQSDKHKTQSHDFVSAFQSMPSQIYQTSASLTTTVTPVSVGSWSSNHVLCNQETVASRGIVHPHSAHSVHSSSRPGQCMPVTTHSIPGAIQQSWVEPKFLRNTPVHPERSGFAGSVLIAGGRNEIPCPGIQSTLCNHHQAQQHSFQQTQPDPALCPGREANTWRGLAGAPGWESSRCEKCYYCCFLTAQMIFVTGIVVGFSLLVAGGVFHRRHVAQFQVLVYIGAMVSLVCVLLLVIFCAMGRDRRPRRSRRTSLRYLSCPQVLVDCEVLPLQSVDASGPQMMVAGEGSPAGEMQQIGDIGVVSPSICLAKPVDHKRFYITPASHRECTLGTGNHNIANTGSANQKALALIDSDNHGAQAIPVMRSEMPPHLGRTEYSVNR
ncbi:uncharacterized protein LOC125031317 [Penaeus chinensis]|uniref:uncharacterized protein LOC125031317 n=1 Tax=Penaeus chinensis TaxID=139456 RepID=UPI001FB6A9D6|nr:uncharacterized protein LOC125031317 [Penaeus chinensis]